MLTELKSQLHNLEQQISQKKGQLSLLSNQISEANNKLMDNEDKEMTYRQAIEVLDVAQERIRNTIKTGFEGLVTKGLETVFGSGHGMMLEFGRRGVLQEAEFKLIRPNCPTPVPYKNSTSGGEFDVIACALRIVVLELFSRNNKSPLLLDEPFKCVVSTEYRELCARFIMEINKQINRQILMITPDEAFIPFADNVIDFEKLEKEIPIKVESQPKRKRKKTLDK